MAVDPAQVAGQEGVAVDRAAESSGADQEQSNPAWFRGLLDRGRGLLGLTGADASGGGTEDGPGEQATAEPETITLTKAELDARIRSESQSLTDRNLAAERWKGALEAADAGDTRQLRVMAARGHGPAQRELAKRGETYELGEAVAESLQQQAADDAAMRSRANDLALFDANVLDPVMGLLPEAEQQKVLASVKDVEDGFAHRRAVVDATLKAYRKLAVEQAKEELLKDPVFRKEALVAFRGTPEHQEPDQVEAAAASRPGDMDTVIRAAVGVR